MSHSGPVPRHRPRVVRFGVLSTACMYPYMSVGVTSQVYLQQNKKKTEAESKNCHAKTMLSLEKPIKLI
jgi:hypothetical protein